MSNYKYIQESGVIVPDTATVKAEVEQEFKTALGADLNVSDSTPQGRLIAAEVEARSSVLKNNAIMANLINPNESFGVFLSAICALFNVPRNIAYSSRVLGRIQGVPGTVIPAGSWAKTRLGDIFYLENAATIPAAGYILTYFLSLDKGAIPCQTGDLNQIVTPVLGWELISNGAPAQVGAPNEGDTPLKVRRNKSLYQGTALMQSIMSRLSQVENLASSYGYENYTDGVQTVDGIAIKPHSIYIVADGGADNDVATAIFESKSAGCNYTGTVEAIVTDEAYGVPYKVYFNRPSYLPCKVYIKVKTPTGGSSSEIIQNIKNAVLAFAAGEVEGVDGLGVGVSLSPFELAAAVSAQIPSLFLLDVQVAKEDEELSREIIHIKINEVASISESDIEVEVI